MEIAKKYTVSTRVQQNGVPGADTEQLVIGDKTVAPTTINETQLTEKETESRSNRKRQHVSLATR
ncbi:hypothetical protein [Listeria newyorkensis]|uniref:Uncharacterized protein n=1 Tax=Listeria newyorkensis TaxID=1497681 RepID=A0A841YVD7_9LIST|nr:hypothetical protein [Listeria newyorkensis]MBC1457248.1 hypothetical protein [Listeria newyorkensis]